MVMKYTDYYRHFGVRRAMQMVAPPMVPMQNLALPREAILHYLPVGAEPGIPLDDALLRHAPAKLYVEHVLELAEDKRGNPRPSMMQVSKVIRDYHRKYRRIRQLHDLGRALKDPQALIVESYAILPQLYRYPANIYRPYNKWYNIQSTFWERVGQIATESQRPQFLECRLPATLPSKGRLLKGTSATVSTKILSLFPDHESLFILELWKWLSVNRETSILHKLPKSALDQLNLIWVESGKWFVINLGLLDQWRAPTKDEIDAGVPERKGLKPQLVQNMFLRLLMFLMEARTSQGGEAKPLTEGETVEHEEGGAQVVEQPATIEVNLNDSDEEIVLEPGLDFGKLPIDAIEETEENLAKIEEIIAKDLEALDHLEVERELAEDEELTFEPPVDLTDEEPMLDLPALKDITLQEGVMAKANQLADMGLLSAAEYRRMQALSEAFTKLPDPYGKAPSLTHALEIHASDLKIESARLAPSIEGVPDHSMLHSTLAELDPKYLKHVLHKDVGNAVLAVQKAGVAVTGYRVEEVHDAMNHAEKHEVQLTPVRGKASTVHFKLPKVAEDGTFIANGTKYRLARQRVDLPLRKVDAETVALTSYYGKVFVGRSEKKVASYSTWVTNQVAARGMDTANDTVTDMMLANVYDNNLHTPRIYSTLGQRFRSFTVGDLHLNFDHAIREQLVGEDVVKALEIKGMVVAGTKGADKEPVLVGPDNVFYLVKHSKGEPDLEVLGTIEELLDLDTSKSPREYAEIKVFGKLIPVGLFLSYHLGFNNLLKLLEVQPIRRVQQGEHARLGADEYAITFEDEKLVFNKGTDRAGLILQGLATLNDMLANYQGYLFDKKAIYGNILDRMGLGVRYIREMELMVDMFVDPITKEILEQMGEPTTVVGLILRACDMLLTDWAPDETDSEHQRFRGYERFAGVIYSALTNAIRQQRARGTSNAPIDISPYAVWQDLMKDSAVRLVEESNPIHELRGQEEVTFSGTGGRSSRSMVGGTRRFHDNDRGVISESTKDSADVAITTFTTANPQFTDVRGLTKRYKRGDTGPASMISTSALLAPCADRDDPKRVNFIAIQNSSSTFTLHQRPSPLRTGYERVMAHRTSDLYATTAKQDGTVTKVGKGVIEVTYRDGSHKVVELGRRYGKVANLTVPHEVQTTLSEGDKVKQGDIIAFNKHYFEIDPLDKKQALLKSGVLLNTAIQESADTLEDSSAISLRAAKLLETQFTEVRSLVVAFDQSIHDMVQVGTHVDVDSILCTIEDPITAETGIFDDASRDTLKMIASNTPKAKAAGKVERVEVFYHGDVDDLSPSLQELAQESDMNRKRRARDLKVPYTSGRVDDSMRIDGNPLIMDHAVIRVYITMDVPAGVGDKGVFANQMKTVFGTVMTGVNRTASGEPIDAKFGYKSISDRIVASPEYIGTTNTLLSVISKRAAAIYKGKK